MCPKLSNVCEIAGLEPEEIKCADKDCCMSNDWDDCKIYISQFFMQ